jgi:inositol 1,4,5-triphosphate receptor type 1
LATGHRKKICQACYGVIKNYLRGDSRKNENYLARFLAFFKTQVGMKLNAEEVMIEMVEDNRYIS